MLPETARMKYGRQNGSSACIKKCAGEENISREDMLLLLSGVLRLLQKQILFKEDKISGIK
jgi:hypothetical protein